MQLSQRQIVIAAIAGAVLVVLVAVTCASRSDEVAAPAPAVTSPAAGARPSPSPPSRPAAPLTGLEVASLDVLERPVLALKIENTAAARPQAGLADADIVIEELVEGGITRFVALFHSTLPPAIGPIRSGRFVDADLLPAFDPVFGLSGAADVVARSISRSGVTTVYDDGDGHPYYRESGRRAPHDLFADPRDILDVAPDDVPAARPAFAYDPEPPIGASACPPAPRSACAPPGVAIEVRLSGVSRAGWVYDRDLGRYVRSQNDTPFPDADGRPVTAANVILFGMRVGSGGGADPAGNPLTETEVLGTGRAIVLRDGQWYEARWSKASAAQHFVVAGPDGRPMRLAPGPTWMHLVPVQNLPDPPG